MINLQDLRVFTEIVQSNSFAAAASKLGLSPATASGRLKVLEETYGLCLINRTTRSLSVTEEGKLLYERSIPLLEEFDQLHNLLSDQKKSESGLISISTPSEFGRNQVLPLINEFSELYKEIEFRIVFEDCAKVQSTDECDLMIRFGPLPDCALTTRKLSANPVLTCASPKYLEKAGTPQQVQDLASHNCIRLESDAVIAGDWRFFDNGELVTHRSFGSHSVSDVGALLDLAASGVGVVQATYWDVCDLLESGELCVVLDDKRAPDLMVSLLSESRDKLPNRTQMFIDFLVQNIRSYSDAVLGQPETRLRLVAG